MTELIYKSEQAEWQMLSSVLHTMRMQLHAMSGFQRLFELPLDDTGFVNPAQLGLRVARRIMALIGGHLYIDTNYADGVRIVAELGMYHQILTNRLSTS